jgi:hypothetical protein
VPAVLAFVLLAIQLTIPWTVSRLITEDGPSHLYTAVVARNLLGNLLLGRGSHYGGIYHFNPVIVPNWASSVLLGAFVTIAGVDHAEKLLMSFSLLAGFLAIGYAIWSLSPESLPWTPLINILVQVWFLWLGFYNFYLGMALSPLVVAYFFRNIHRLSVRRALIIGAGLCGLYLTHLVAAAIAGLVLAVVATWVYWVVPGWRDRRFFPASLRQLALLIAAILPTLGLFLLFAVKSGASSGEPLGWHPEFARAFSAFPMHIFATGAGRLGGQDLIWPVILCLVALSFGAMRSAEWASAKGGLAFAVLLVFLGYLIIPDRGLGGGEAKIRFSWGVLLWGAILVGSGRRFRLMQVPLAVYFSAFLVGNLFSTENALKATNRAVEDYLSLASHIKPGATLVRLRYPTPDLPRQYGFEDIGRDPLFHVDAFIAARCKCIDLSDYQAPNLIFPVVFRPSVNRTQQYGLWGLQSPGPTASESFAWLSTSLPVRLDYVIVLADDDVRKASDPDYVKLLAKLNENMRLVATSRSNPFVRLYERTSLQAKAGRAVVAKE